MESSKEEETKTFCYQEATAMMDADKYISRDFYHQYQIKRIMIVQSWSFVWARCKEMNKGESKVNQLPIM